MSLTFKHWEDMMLRINKMTNYAIRVVRAIYIDPDKVVTSVVISQRENVPLPILFKVLRVLNAAGIIASRRGRGDKVGGYELIADPAKITLLDIISIVQGDVYLSDCLQDEDICFHRNGCGIHLEIQRINDVLRKECSAKSIKELVDFDLAYDSAGTKK
jgi:Rrf2 family protein